MKKKWIQKTAIAAAILTAVCMGEVCGPVRAYGAEQATETAERTPAVVLDEIDADFEQTIQKINQELERVNQTAGVSYDTYLENKDMVSGWYGYVLAEEKALFLRTEQKAAEYLRLIAATADYENYKAWDEEMDKLYDRVYTAAMSKFYDAIYTESMGKAFDTYYNGVVGNGFEETSYSEWLGVLSDCYNDWLAATSDIYSEWLKAQSQYYQMWLVVGSGFYSRDLNVDKLLEPILTKVETSAEETESAEAV